MPDEGVTPPDVAREEFLDEPTRDPARWRWLWEGDHPFPVRSHRGVLGRLLVAGKRLLRPFVKVPQNDLWERQRVFNLILLEWLHDLGERRVEDRLAHLETWVPDRLAELVRHNDALFARLDQKLDLYRRQAEDLLTALGAGLATLEQGEGAVGGAAPRAEGPAAGRVGEEQAGGGAGPAGGGAGGERAGGGAGPVGGGTGREQAGGGAGREQAGGGVLPAAARTDPERLRRAWEERGYLELERRFRGTEEEIAERLAVYRPHLEGRGEVLDLGCGRGEALALFAGWGLAARGVDASAAMVAHCRQRGLAAEEGDLLDALAAAAPASLGAVVSFHVVEHLKPEQADRLARLAWRALRPGGALILETPNPLSLVVAARNFWLDPTHRRPVHPEALEHLLRLAGFDPVERLDLRPFAAADRLPEIDLAEVPEAQRPLAHRLNLLRDRLDDLLYGYQDYALVGEKPASG
jgi:SAM-dependent methyltransferase